MRPGVLIASTHPVTTMVLASIMRGQCRDNGLKLVTPESGSFQSADELFEFLSMQHPAELADWLVLLDLGEASLDEAFAPHVSKRDSGWHAGDHRSGVAVELLLRFPQVYPVFMSISVPPCPGEPPAAGEDKENRSQRHEGEAESGAADDDDGGENQDIAREWRGFENLKESLTVAHCYGENKPDIKNDTQNKHDRSSEEQGRVHKSNSDEVSDNSIGAKVNSEKQQLISEACKSSTFAFEPFVHFVSPFDIHEDQCKILSRFANGLRCWFDPTGLRTLVKNRFLGTLFGDKDDWSNTWPRKGNDGADNKESVLRKRLLERLDRVAVAIDEEREFAMLNAYAAWKYGRRGWVVTTYAGFEAGSLWRHDNAADMVILRDIDLRFPDMYFTQKSVKRSALMDISSGEWKDDVSFLGKCQVRAISGEKAVHRVKRGKPRNWMDDDDIRLGQKVGNGKGLEYLGYPKPLSSLYELRGCLGKNGKEAVSSVLGKLGVVRDTYPDSGSSGHGAPYRNHGIAKFLLSQARRCGRGTEENLVAALLASEAYEILLGMSKETGLSALEAMHRAEVRAEVAFSGITETASIDERKVDLQETLQGLFQSVSKPFQRRRLFVAQIWEDLRSIYKNAERFHAAEQANIESLVHSEWGRRFKVRVISVRLNST